MLLPQRGSVVVSNLPRSNQLLAALPPEEMELSEAGLAGHRSINLAMWLGAQIHASGKVRDGSCSDQGRCF